MPKRRYLIESYIIELLLSILVTWIVYKLPLSVRSTIIISLQDLTIIIGIYSIIIAVSLFVIGLLFSESDQEYLKWLLDHGGESVYRNAAFYSLSVQLASVVYLLLATKIPQHYLVDILSYFSFSLTIIITVNEIRLCFNYLELKRTYQKNVKG